MAAQPPPSGSLPVQTITGFLGAGKTTLIQRLLTSRPDGLRVAVVVNEFGKLPFDGAMLRAGAVNTDAGAIYDLPGGCICCTQAAQLAEMLDRLTDPAAGRPAFQRVLIEASGAATADGIVLTLFAQPPLPGRIPLELAPTVAVVDCETILKRLTWDIYVLKQQLQVADLVVLNRSAGLSASGRAAIETAIRQYAPIAPLIAEPAPADAWETVCRPRFAAVDFIRDKSALPPQDHRHLHAGMEQLELPLPAGVPVSALAQAIERWALDTAFGQVLRAKGFVAGASGIRALELAGGRVFQRKMTVVDGCATGRLVVIGKNLQTAALENSLTAAGIGQPG